MLRKLRKNPRDLATNAQDLVRKCYPEWATVEATNHYRVVVEQKTPMGPAPPRRLEVGERLAAIISTSWNLVPQYTALDDAARRLVSQPYTFARTQAGSAELAKYIRSADYVGYGFAVLILGDDYKEAPFLSPNACCRKAIWPF
jgi:hypothetical protein